MAWAFTLPLELTRDMAKLLSGQTTTRPPLLTWPGLSRHHCRLIWIACNSAVLLVGFKAPSWAMASGVTNGPLPSCMATSPCPGWTTTPHPAVAGFLPALVKEPSVKFNGRWRTVGVNVALSFAYCREGLGLAVPQLNLSVGLIYPLVCP